MSIPESSSLDKSFPENKSEKIAYESYNKILIKVNNQFSEMEALLKRIEKDIQLMPLIFAVSQLFLWGVFFTFFLMLPYTKILFQIISIPKTLSLLLSIVSGWWCYSSYSSVKIAYKKYRRVRQNLLEAKSIKMRITRLLELLSFLVEDDKKISQDIKNFTKHRINSKEFF